MRISARNVGKVWGEVGDPNAVVALEDFSHEFESNRVTCLLGPSGCGKSTLMEIIGGIEPLTSGEISIHADASDGPRGAAAGAGSSSRRPSGLSAIVWQDFNLFPWLTVQRNVTFGLEMKGTPKEEREERAGELLSRVGLSPFVDHFPHQLSGGMKQRVALARAFAVDPRVVLMDEPFGALDAQTRMVMQEELLSMLDADVRTVVFVTHSIEESLLLGDQVIVMTARPGRVGDLIDVDIPKPRSGHDTRRDPKYQGLFDRAYATLREEVSRAREIEEAAIQSQV